MTFGSTHFVRNSFETVMGEYHCMHRAYKFQMAVDVMFHKAVDPALITQATVTLRSELAAVYSDGSPPLEDISRQLLNLIDVYKHNGSGWVFSSFAPLQLALWHLDPLRRVHLYHYQRGFVTKEQLPGWEEGDPLHVTDDVIPDRHVDLPLHKMGGIQHYSKIKNFSWLVSSQLSNHAHAT